MYKAEWEDSMCALKGKSFLMFCLVVGFAILFQSHTSCVIFVIFAHTIIVTTELSRSFVPAKNSAPPNSAARVDSHSHSHSGAL